MKKMIGIFMLVVFFGGAFVGVVAQIGFLPALIVGGVVAFCVCWLYAAIHLMS